MKINSLVVKSALVACSVICLSTGQFFTPLQAEEEGEGEGGDFEELSFDGSEFNMSDFRESVFFKNDFRDTKSKAFGGVHRLEAEVSSGHRKGDKEIRVGVFGRAEGGVGERHQFEYGVIHELAGDWVPSKIDVVDNGGFTNYPGNGSPVPYELNGHVDIERGKP